MSDIPMGLTPDEEAAWERALNTPPEMTPDEAREDMAQGYARVIEEALTHIENLLDVADNCVVPGSEEAVSAARKFWNDMNLPGKYDDADDPRYR